MVDRVSKEFKNVIVVVNSSNAMELGWLDQYDRLYADAQEAYAKKLNEFTEKTGKPSMLYAFENPFEEPEQPEITEADVKEAMKEV